MKYQSVNKVVEPVHKPKKEKKTININKSCSSVEFKEKAMKIIIKTICHLTNWLILTPKINDIVMEREILYTAEQNSNKY